MRVHANLNLTLPYDLWQCLPLIYRPCTAEFTSPYTSVDWCVTSKSRLANECHASLICISNHCDLISIFLNEIPETYTSGSGADFIRPISACYIFADLKSKCCCSLSRVFCYNKISRSLSRFIPCLDPEPFSQFDIQQIRKHHRSG